MRISCDIRTAAVQVGIGFASRAVSNCHCPDTYPPFGKCPPKFSTRQRNPSPQVRYRMKPWTVLWYPFRAVGNAENHRRSCSAASAALSTRRHKSACFATHCRVLSSVIFFSRASSALPLMCLITNLRSSASRLTEWRLCSSSRRSLADRRCRSRSAT